MTAERMAYIGRASCGCIRLATVDEDLTPERRRGNAREIARAIRDGLTIERVTCQYVRDNMLRCPHGLDPEPKAKTVPMFGESVR